MVSKLCDHIEYRDHLNCSGRMRCYTPLMNKLKGVDGKKKYLYPFKVFAY